MEKKTNFEVFIVALYKGKKRSTYEERSQQACSLNKTHHQLKFTKKNTFMSIHLHMHHHITYQTKYKKQTNEWTNHNPPPPPPPLATIFASLNYATTTQQTIDQVFCVFSGSSSDVGCDSSALLSVWISTSTFW